jgi:tryptophan synthase alpha chain
MAKRKTLVVYLMAMPDTPALAQAAVEAGADVIEIGFPFSDPLADGPVIRRAGELALAAGMRTARCLEVLAEIRSRVDVPLVPMTYASIFDAYGWEKLDRDARAAGATALIVPDLPVDVHPDLHRVQLVAPTSTDERLRLAAEATDGWLYLVTVTGTTGARADLAPTLAPLAERTRAITSVPLYAGFGISTREHAQAAAELVDGVVVGSAAVAAAEHGAATLTELVSSLRGGLDAAVGSAA